MKYRAVFLLLFCIQFISAAQTRQEKFFRMVEIRTDSFQFNSLKNRVTYNEEEYLYFFYNDDQEVAEIKLHPESASSHREIMLLPSGDFEIVDSLVFYNDAWICKLRFRNLTQSQFLKLQFVSQQNDAETMNVVHLLPCTKTTVSLKPASDELYIGEEKTFELISNNVNNIRFSGDWTSGLPIDYRLERQNNLLQLHLLPNELGRQDFNTVFQVEKPYIDTKTNTLTWQTGPVDYPFFVRESRLKFLNIDKREITLDEESRTQGVEIQLDYSKQLQLNKTYRVENQEEPGGVLVAEIYTRSLLSTNKMLCYLKTYNYHKSSDGYLYIKDGDNPQFIANFNITPAASIDKIFVMREGSDWSPNLSVYPGETVDVKIEGRALYKTQLHFEELIDLTTDTLIQREDEVILKLQVPLNINKKRVNLYNYSTPTGNSLNVKEYEEPRPFDYVMIDYGDMNRTLSGIHGTILYEKAVRDVVFTFNGNRIDSDDKLYGIQNLTIDVRITDSDNDLVDMKTISNVKVCPSDRSPRYKFYDKKNCIQDELRLNKYLSKNTNDLEDWSKIHLSVKSEGGNKQGASQQKEVDIILKKRYKFDIDVSFPAGLITLYKDTEESSGDVTYTTLTGISMAMIAQFSFYHPDKIAKMRPYKIGAGFLAINAFNFESESQDLATVALISLYPTTKNRKMSFPLYFGGGYKIKDAKWMLLIGPGISVSL